VRYCGSSISIGARLHNNPALVAEPKEAFFLSHEIHIADRRGFLKSAGGAALALVATRQTVAGPLSEKEKLSRIASNTYPTRSLFKRRAGGRPDSPETEAMKKKYRELTMLEFPEFTKETFPGVYKMDLWSSLFGDFSDDSMYTQVSMTYNGRERTFYEFDPSSSSGKKWLDRLANKMKKTATKCQHISNNAPRNICDLDEAKRREGISIAKKWLDGAAVLGAKTMRVNSGGPRITPSASATSGYPKNDEIVKYIAKCIESFKEMADYGGKRGVKITLENHWGLTADPTNIRIILDEVNHPFCEATPDFCNWEHEYMLYHGLKDLVPYAHTTAHAKYWDRWKNPDVQRCVRIMTDGGFKGVFALEYEDGPWDGVEGAKYLYREVLAAL
jgi:sugar phosphate isomerase/epimerase